MTLTTSNITGRVPLPSDSAPKYAEVVFTLTKLDTEGDQVIPGGASSRFVLDANGDMPAGATLWRNTEGLRATAYRMVFNWDEFDRVRGTVRRTHDAGLVQVGDDASYTIAQMINNTPVPVPADTYWSSITQEQYDAAIEAADAAAVSAAQAALYDGPKVDTFAELSAVTAAQVSVGGLIRVIESAAVFKRAEDAATDSDLDYIGVGGVKWYEELPPAAKVRTSPALHMAGYKRIHLVLDLQYPGYSDAIADDAVSWLYPQGARYDPVEDALWVGLSSSAASSGYCRFVKYDFSTGAFLGSLKAGRAFPEGFAIRHFDDGRIELHTRSESGLYAGNVGFYDIKDHPLDGSEATQVGTLTGSLGEVKVLYQMDFRNGEYFLEQPRPVAGGSYYDRSTICVYGEDGEFSRLISLPTDDALGLYGEVSWVGPKRQSFAVGGSFIAAGMGGLWAETGYDETPQGAVIYSFDGKKLAESLVQSEGYFNALSNAGLPVTRIENEGIFIGPDSRVFALVPTGNSTVPGSKMCIVEEFPAPASDDLIDLTAIEAPNVGGIDTNDYWPSFTTDSLIRNPQSGEVLDTMPKIFDFMSRYAVRRFSFYSTTFPGILDGNGAVISSTTLVTIQNCNSGTFFFELLRTTGVRSFLWNGAQTELTGRMSRKDYSGAYVIDDIGAGSPEGVINAAAGSTWRRTDGGSGTSLYVKETPSGNTGWVAK